MKFHFWQSERYEIHTRIEFQMHIRINRNIQRVCAYSLRLFVLAKLCSHENLMPVWNFRSKWSIWSPYRFEFHFSSIYVNISKELTEYRSEIFNRNEISYRFEFILPVVNVLSGLLVCLSHCLLLPWLAVLSINKSSHYGSM